MSRIKSEPAEAARKKFPLLIEQAHQGKPTIVTKHGRPYAAIVPITDIPQGKGQLDIQSLRGSGKGLWGRYPLTTLEKMRREWQQ
ncbi:MAG TPA: type II toxin-antitoxin system prevent-host-death family antitoxin [Burkholderiales bacterium]|nr:type II toxin-antitoxin system prevent-host-death family antitoxin [Burkholderiales bacterium]